MLTRIKYRRDFRQFTRFLSDKPSDGDDKPIKNKKVVSKKENKDDPTADLPQDSREKIQALLKSMLTAKPVISDKEYMERFTVAPERKSRAKEPNEFEVSSEQIEENITKAAGDVAQALGGDVKQTESELLSKILGNINQSPTNLSDLLVGMKVDRTTEKDTFVKETRGQQVKRLVSKSNEIQKTTRFVQRRAQPDGDERPKRTAPAVQSINIFSGEPLGIFKSASEQKNYGTKLDVWDKLKERELTLATSQPSSNYFHKMIQWTEQGKVWKFPIDNEQGIEEEQNVHFSEHIFLDQHLEGWCPKRGPIRHFMELVCVGLSKNAFYTIKEKTDHIMWYKEYFESKKDLLIEVGAWDTQKPSAGAEASI